MQAADTYRALARYNRYMNEQLYACAAELKFEERHRDLGAFFKSIHGTFNHGLLTDRAWLKRFTGDREVYESRDGTGNVIEIRALNQILYEEFEDLQSQRTKTDGHIVAWADSLTDAALAEPFSYRNTTGAKHEHALWWAATHFFNHQTHHRGQAHAMLTRLGSDPGCTDFAILARDGKLEL